MQQNKVSVKYSEENSVSYYLLLEFLWEGVGGAYSKLGAY